ncbi:MAG: hypothetical protein JSV79_13380 [Armatimonadota bacterium]|nr:MAG: hypothetical protein JSV79_13380 [Armatimonadota bacterium]
MATSESSFDEVKPVEPLIGAAAPLEVAADTMLAASRTMLAAAASLSSALGPTGVRWRELTAEAIEAGFLRALRRDSLFGGTEEQAPVSSLLGLPVRRGGLAGTGYGRMGASITGKGGRSQLYGTIGGAVGYAVGGPVGALLGGMLGGLFGGDDDDARVDAERARQEEELRRQWLNTPEGFEIEAYLYNLARNYAFTTSLVPAGTAAWQTPFLWSNPSLSGAPSGRQIGPVLVTMSPGAVQIAGQGQEAGERAARAFAGALGRVLRLNSVVVPAAGLGGDL